MRLVIAKGDEIRNMGAENIGSQQTIGARGGTIGLNVIEIDQVVVPVIQALRHGLRLG